MSFSSNWSDMNMLTLALFSLALTEVVPAAADCDSYVLNLSSMSTFVFSGQSVQMSLMESRLTRWSNSSGTDPFIFMNRSDRFSVMDPVSPVKSWRSEWRSARNGWKIWRQNKQVRLTAWDGQTLNPPSEPSEPVSGFSFEFQTEWSWWSSAETHQQRLRFEPQITDFCFCWLIWSVLTSANKLTKC